MEGMGELKEKILKLITIIKFFSTLSNSCSNRASFSNHTDKSLDNDNCEFSWTTEIEPEIFAEGIHQGMLVFSKSLKKYFLDAGFSDAFYAKSP